MTTTGRLSVHFEPEKLIQSSRGCWDYDCIHTQRTGIFSLSHWLAHMDLVFSKTELPCKTLESPKLLWRNVSLEDSSVLFMNTQQAEGTALTCRGPLRRCLFRFTVFHWIYFRFPVKTCRTPPRPKRTEWAGRTGTGQLWSWKHHRASIVSNETFTFYLQKLAD